MPFLWYPHRESLRLTYANCPHDTGTHLYWFLHDFLIGLRYLAGAGAQFTGLCAYPPVRFPKLDLKRKNTSLRCVFTFGTPIGNRTLVSAVRGRRLEPLDHEGKSILLCDNSIILCSTQAKICIFSQKNCFWRSTTVLFGDYDKKISNSVLILDIDIIKYICNKIVRRKLWIPNIKVCLRLGR